MITKTLSMNQGDSQARMQVFDGQVSQGESESVQETGADLISLNEIRELLMDEQFVFLQGCKPIRCQKARYFEHVDFVGRCSLGGAGTKSRFHLTRFHGVFAPNSRHRATVTSESQEKQVRLTSTEGSGDCEERRGKISWAMRLKRVFNIDITVCRHCQGSVRIIACIEDAQVINEILSHMHKHQAHLGQSRRHQAFGHHQLPHTFC